MEELFARFPDMRPVTSVPSLYTLNGFGTTLIGRRDYDPETGTYVKTHCLCALFIPVVALGSYRVADAPNGGWYFVGKVPLSRFAKRATLGFVLAVLAAVGAIAGVQYTRSPEFKAGRAIAEADDQAAGGNPGRAAEGYRAVMDGTTGRAGEARAKLAALIADPPPPPAETAAVYRVAVDLHRQNRCPVPDVFDRGAAVARRYADADPAAALAVLEVIAPYAPDPATELALREQLLTKLVAADPGNPELVSRLAAVYDATGRRDRCEQLLTPLEARLGSLDGAAILGRIHAAAGRPDRAYALLKPYVDGRLAEFVRADEALTAAGAAAQQRVVNDLQMGAAAGFDYARFEKAAKPEQSAMLHEYLAARVKDDPALRDARQAVVRHAAVVGAALDLGMLQLQRGQATADPAGRKAALEGAEKTFLSIRSVAGEADAYRLYLGQVYYWLGKAGEGKKLFDQLLADRGRPAELLLQVARTLREVGSTSDGRKLAEEAYETAGDGQMKQRAAQTRALIPIDLDDSLTWLARSGSDPETRASLAYHRGAKAARDGDDRRAEGLYREAVGLYATMPENASTLNNSALAHFELYQVTHDREEFTRAADKLDRAIALQPSDSILLHNAANNLIEAAIRDAVGGRIDLRVLNRSARWDLLPFLYADPAGRQAVIDRVKQHPGTVKARGYLEKPLLLAPKRDDGYQQLTALFLATRDDAGLAAVRDRLAGVELDLAQEEADYREYLAGKKDAKYADENRAALARAEKAVAEARGKKGATFAAAVAAVLRARTTEWTLGRPVDLTALVTLAEEAAAADPSDGARMALVVALRLRAHEALTRKDPVYAKEADRTRRTVGVSLLDYVLSVPGPLRDRAAADPDVKRMQDLVAESVRRLPDEAGPWQWAVLTAGRPAEAAAVADRVKADRRGRLRRELERATVPYASSGVLDEYWALQIAGKDAEAKQVLQTAAARKVPVPEG